MKKMLVIFSLFLILKTNAQTSTTSFEKGIKTDGKLVLMSKDSIRTYLIEHKKTFFGKKEIVITILSEERITAPDAVIIVDSSKKDSTTEIFKSVLEKKQDNLSLKDSVAVKTFKPYRLYKKGKVYEVDEKGEIVEVSPTPAESKQIDYTIKNPEFEIRKIKTGESNGISSYDFKRFKNGVQVF